MQQEVEAGFHIMEINGVGAAELSMAKTQKCITESKVLKAVLVRIDRGNPTQALRLGRPATEWEAGSEPKMAEKWPAKWPAAIFWGGVPNWPKNGRANSRTAKIW